MEKLWQSRYIEFLVPFLSHQKSTKRKFKISQEFSVSGVQTPDVHGLNPTSSWLGGVLPPEELFELSLEDCDADSKSIPQKHHFLLLECMEHCSLVLIPASSPGLPPAAEETFGLLMVQIYKQCDLFSVQTSPLQVFWETKVGNWKRDHKT